MNDLNVKIENLHVQLESLASRIPTDKVEESTMNIDRLKGSVEEVDNELADSMLTVVEMLGEE